MITRPGDGPRRPLLLQALLPWRRDALPGDVAAGLTLAAIAIPEAMGYAKIAGMPVITGLYTMLVPAALFALAGSSRRLVVGADSATAAMLAAGIAGVALPGSDAWVALAGVLALMTAAFLLLARVVRLGFLADFLSRTVLVGFLTGVGIQVACGQVPGMLGLEATGSGPVERIAGALAGIREASPAAVAVAAGVIAVILGARRISRRIPAALVAVAGATAATWALDLAARGLPVVGAVPGGLPVPRLPDPPAGWSALQDLIPLAFGMFVVILAQSAATARAYAARYGERVDENADLLGLCLANVGAALSGAFTVNGSPTKTAIVDAAGGRSQVAHLTMVAVVALVLLFLTAPLAWLPEAALSAVVFLIGVGLVDVAGLRRIRAERPWEFWTALTTTAVVALWGVEPGILLAVFLSLLVHTRHGYRPRNVVLLATPDGFWRARPVESAAQLAPGLIAYRFTHGLYYANAGVLEAEVTALAAAARPRLTWLCIDASAIDDVDYTAAETLRALHARLAADGVRLVLAGVAPAVRDQLARSGLEAALGADAFHATLGEAVAAYRSSR